jgi:transposase-like protein
VRKRLPPSTLLEQAIEALLGEDLANAEKLAELGRLGARLVIQRAVEEEVSGFLGRAHYQRAAEAQGYRNGVRPRRLQTAEGELEIQMPQLRDTAARFVCRTIPETRTVIRTRPVEALVIGAYVRGLSDRDLESLLREAGLGKLSKSTASRICKELRDRYRAFQARSLKEIELLVLFLDAIYLPTRPSGAKEGVLVAWGYDLEGRTSAARRLARPTRAAGGLAGDGSGADPSGIAHALAGRGRRGAWPAPGDRRALAHG